MFNKLFYLGGQAHERQIKKCYRYYEAMSNLIGISDYTDGIYFGDKEISYEQAQQNQTNYLLDEAKVVAGMTVLDIGCGRGRLLEAIEARGGKAIGITLSEEQHNYCVQKGLEVYLLNYKDIANDWDKRFDAIIANGSLEHFVSTQQGLNRQASKVYHHLFESVHRLINPESSSARFVTTAIHHRIDYGSKPKLSIKNKLMFSLLNRIYSGWYPLNGQLEHCAKDLFKTVRMEDGTTDYLWTSQQAFKGWYKHCLPRPRHTKNSFDYFWQLLKTGVDAPLYFFNPILWTWQFKGAPPPVILNRHTWQRIKS